VIEAATDGLDVSWPGAPLPLAKTFLDEIKEANQRLGRVVSNLLDMTRIETGRLPLNPEWCEPAELLHSTADQLRNEISAKRIQIIASKDLPLVRLDVGLMEQALCNLLTNAAAYSPAGSPIRLAAHMDGQNARSAGHRSRHRLAPGERRRYSGSSIAAPTPGPAEPVSACRSCSDSSRPPRRSLRRKQSGRRRHVTIRLPVETARPTEEHEPDDSNHRR